MFSRFKLNRIVMMIVCLVIAWSLKYHYSHSSSDDLRWILMPTAYLVELTGDMTFEREINTGYADQENGIIIAPSCSGVNFMIIAFCLSAYVGLKSIKTTPMQLAWIVASIISSYIYTLFVNVFRINLSIYSIKTEFLQSWFSAETVHLLEGVLVYFIFLLIYNYLLNRIINPVLYLKPEENRSLIRILVLPSLFYLSFTLLLPVLNHGGFPPNNGFFKYAFIVLLGCFLVFVLFFLFRSCCHYAVVRVK